MKKIAVVVPVLLLVAVVLYYVIPPLWGKAMLRSAARDAGFQEKTVTVDGHAICYLEGGEGEPLLLLHGFGARKEDWLAFASGLLRDFRVIIPDLPGSGASDRIAGATYDVANQAKRLREFAAALKIEKMHVAGNSLGAAIAGKLTTDNPEMIRTLALFDAACVASAPLTESQELMVKQGKNVLAPTTRREMGELLDLVFTKKPEIAFILMEYLTREAIAESEFRKEVARAIWEKERYALEDDAAKIVAKTLILWGGNDKLTHISGAYILGGKIKNSRVVIIENCGHAPMLEKPAETMSAFLSFVRG